MRTDRPQMEKAETTRGSDLVDRYTEVAEYLGSQYGTSPDDAFDIADNMHSAGVPPGRWVNTLQNLQKTGVPWGEWIKLVKDPKIAESGKLTGLWRPFASGASANWADELAGVLGGDEAQSAYKVQEEMSGAAHPVASSVAKLAGAVLPGALGGAGAAGLAGRLGMSGWGAAMAGGGLAGGLEGAASGAGAAPEGQRGGGALVGGLLGAAGGAVGSTLPIAVGKGVNKIRDAAKPSRVLEREVASVNSAPGLRSEYMDFIGSGHPPAFSELDDKMGARLAQIATGSPEARSEALKASFTRLQAAKGHLDKASAAYDSFAQQTVNPTSKIRTLMAHYGKDMMFRNQPIDARRIIDLRKVVKTMANSKAAESGTKATKYELLNNDLDYLTNFLESEGVPIRRLDEVYDSALRLVDRATKVDDSIRRAASSQAAFAVHGSDLAPGDIPTTQQGVMSRLMNAVGHGLTDRGEKAASALPMFDPNSTQRLLSLPMPPDNTNLWRGLGGGFGGGAGGLLGAFAAGGGR